MGWLEDGAWRSGWYDTGSTGGEFVREESRFRGRVTADGSSGFRAEPGRYHLYVSLACPWAHRTLILRSLRGLEEAVGVSVVHWLMGDDGWEFREGPGCIPDTVNGARWLRELYVKADPHYTGRVTVPVLWDKATGTIVSNESADIVRMFNGAFDAFAAVPGDYYPAALRPEIDAINEWVYADINNGVYRAGFATTQPAYERAVGRLFAALDRCEALLAGRRYLAGERITEADWRLFTTLVRFDAVYHGHFKCNLRRIADYRNLSGWLRELYQMPGIAQTVNFDHIKGHYYQSHRGINPTGIVPLGPRPDLAAPHGREPLAAARPPATLPS